MSRAPITEAIDAMASTITDVCLAAAERRGEGPEEAQAYARDLSSRVAKAVLLYGYACVDAKGEPEQCVIPEVSGVAR